VRIEHLRVNGFGRLSDFDSGPDPLGRLVVVLGPNESGKSTLFTFLTTALYGFQPASRERNPQVPWGSDEAGGEVRIRLADDRNAVVQRLLRSSPSGKLTIDEAVQDIRNQPLPWVEHIPRTVFRQVFAITLSELAGLDDETWARIQDRVLGSMGATDLHPARAVAEGLEKEAGEIWRPNRRGKQSLREVQDEIRALRARRHETLERDLEIRAKVEERESVLVQLGETRSERQQYKIVLERVQELMPVKRQLDRIDALRTEGGERAELADLPEDPRGTLERLDTDQSRLQRELHTIEEDVAAPAAVLAEYDDEARSLLAHEESITAFLTRTAAVEADRLQLPEIEAEARELEAQAGVTSRLVIDGPCDDALLSAATELSIDLLRDRIVRFEAAVHERDQEQRRDQAEASAASAGGGRAGEGSTRTQAPWAGPGSPARRALPAALAVAGAGLVGWGLAGGPAAATTLGAALLAVGATMALLYRRTEPPAPPSAPSPPVDDTPRLRREIVELVAHLPIRDDRLAPPAPALAVDLGRLQELAGALRAVLARREAAAQRIEGADAEARSVAASLGSGAPESASPFAASLERRLKQADRARNAADGAAREVAQLDRARSRVSEALAEAHTKHADLVERFDALANGSQQLALDVIQARLEAHARADRLVEELEQSYADLAHVKSRIAEVEASGQRLDDDAADVHDLRADIEHHDDTIEGLATRAKALERDAAHLRELETADAVDSAILTLREQAARLTVERDRKWVLAQLIREADRRFREEHQPDLIRRASSYLSHLTGGRYDGLLIDEQSDGDLFQIVGPAVPKPIPLAPPISTGTLEQAYLSLRLAIVDHLDQGPEKLPIFIDEAFVNWDAERRDRGLETLARLSESRQVFAFTCHPELAARLEGHGARILRLER